MNPAKSGGKCPRCPPGFGASKYCAKLYNVRSYKVSEVPTAGLSSDETLDCKSCVEEFYSSVNSSVEMCQPCKKCDAYSEETVQNCTASQNTLCSLKRK